MTIKISNLLGIFCLITSSLTLKSEANLSHNSTIETEERDSFSESYPYQTFSYSKDNVSFSDKFICSDIEAGLISEHLHGKGPNHARIIFENCRKKVYIVYSCSNGLLSESFNLEDFLFSDDCKNISPIHEKVLWSIAISFLGRSFHDSANLNLEILNKIKYSNFFLKKHVLPATRTILESLRANPMLFKKEIIESIQPQTNVHKMIILIRDNFEQGESELEKDPIKYKETIFKISNAFFEMEKERENLREKNNDSPENKQIINKVIRSQNLARVVFKNIIDGNKELIRAFPAKVCQKVKELCKNNVENINTLSDQVLEEFTQWIYEQGTEALSKDIVMPWDTDQK